MLIELFESPDLAVTYEATSDTIRAAPVDRGFAVVDRVDPFLSDWIVVVCQAAAPPP